MQVCCSTRGAGGASRRVSSGAGGPAPLPGRDQAGVQRELAASAKRNLLSFQPLFERAAGTQRGGIVMNVVLHDVGHAGVSGRACVEPGSCHCHHPVRCSTAHSPAPWTRRDRGVWERFCSQHRRVLQRPGAQALFRPSGQFSCKRWD